MNLNHIVDVVFRSAVWHSMRGTPPAYAAAIALGMALLGLYLRRR